MKILKKILCLWKKIFKKKVCGSDVCKSNECEKVCNKRREAFEAGGVYFYDNPDPFGLDYEYYFVNVFSVYKPCTEIPGFSTVTIDELQLIVTDIQQPLCPTLVWAIVNSEPTLVCINPGSPNPVTVVDTPSLKCKGYKICVRPIFD